MPIMLGAGASADTVAEAGVLPLFTTRGVEEVSSLTAGGFDAAVEGFVELGMFRIVTSFAGASVLSMTGSSFVSVTA